MSVRSAKPFATVPRWRDLLAVLQPRWQHGHTLTLLEGGRAYFPALLAAIRAAQTSIYLETYIFAQDETAQAIHAALCDAARRGVRVRLVVDGFGTPAFPAKWQTAFAESGVEYHVFRPEHPTWRIRNPLSRPLSRQRLRRMHRKLALFDEQIAFVGGINLVDDWRADNGQPLAAPRLDFAVHVVGPLVGQLRMLAIRQWWQLDWFQRDMGERPHWRDFPAYWQEWRAARQVSTANRGDTKTFLSLPETTQHALAALALRDNLRHRRTIEDAYLMAFAEARQEVILANAYFFPGRNFRLALCALARRGVRVRLLLQGQSEHPIQYYGSQVLYRDFLRAGVEIYEYQPSFLHAKVAVVDPGLSSTWATVGSSNIDPYSLLLAREANVLVRDPVFSNALLAALDRALAHSYPITLRDLQRFTWWRRLLSWLGYGLLRLGVGLIGQHREY